METTETERDNERQMKMEQLSQIEEFKHNLSQKEDEQTLLQERVDEIQHELRKTVDKHESLVQERDALVQQQSIQSIER